MAGMRLTGRDEAGPQSYTAWFTTYPSTHERAGQTVEVVARWVYEALAEQHAGAVDRIAELEAENARLDKEAADWTRAWAEQEAEMASLRGAVGGQ